MGMTAGKVSFVLPEERSEATFYVAPLIDIVFLLICFYLLVAQLISEQKDPSVELASMANPEIRSEGPAELVINLRRDGAVTVSGRTVSLPALRALLSDQSDAAHRTGRTLRVVVRADRRQKYAKLDEVLETVRRSGIKQIVFRTVRTVRKDPE